MKGTLFSADFVKDSDANLRLLELNTDTGFITNTLSTRFDFTAFIAVLSSNSITELVIIYKSIHAEFVSLLETTIANDATFITTVTKQEESSNTIYPTAPTDSAEKFILRLAYDENALFDSTYCKQRANVQKLFYDNSATGSIPEFYYSGSDYTVNTLRSNINDHDTLPDLVVKSKSEEFTPLSFLNIGNSDSSSADRITDFLDNYHESESKTAEKFHYLESDISSDNKISGIRVIGIVYGTDIELVTIGQWRVQSFFDVPTIEDIDYIAEQGTFISKYHEKHYFQLTSNWLRTPNVNGLYVNSNILNIDDTYSTIQSLTTNDLVKSIYINGLPDGDYMDMYNNWTSAGNSLPSGSYVTSSAVQSLTELNPNTYGILGELKVSDSGSIYSTIGEHFLVYNTSSDDMKFKPQYEIQSGSDFLVDISGGLIPVTANKLIILEDTESGSLYKLDVETTDTYFVSSSAAPFIVHNACFIAGTQITLSDWSTKNIEDVVVGDVVKSFNEETGKQEDKEVLSLLTPLHDDLVKYTLSNGTVITSTFDHPYYVNGLELASYRPEWTNERYDALSGVIEIKVGDVVNLEANDESSVHIISIEELPTEATQTYIFHVKDNMNFYANGILTHNKVPPCCFIAGTEISLSNGDVKNIEDVIIGDVVESYIESIHKNETIGRYESGIVTAVDHRHTVGTHEAACNSLGDTAGVYSLNTGELMFTPEHPFLTKRGWASLVPISTQEPYLSQQDEELVLSVGDFIIEDGKWVEIKTIEHHPMDTDTPVYNITVDVHHNYIANNIVVHNK